MTPCENYLNWPKGPRARATFRSSFVFWRVFLKLWNETLRENLNGRKAASSMCAKVITYHWGKVQPLKVMMVKKKSIRSCHYMSSRTKPGRDSMKYPGKAWEIPGKWEIKGNTWNPGKSRDIFLVSHKMPSINACVPFFVQGWCHFWQ